MTAVRCPLATSASSATRAATRAGSTGAFAAVRLLLSASAPASSLLLSAEVLASCNQGIVRLGN